MIKTTISIHKLIKCYVANYLVIAVLLSFKMGAVNVPPMQARLYAAWYGDDAVAQMVQYKIPASVILAQAIFESCCGNSDLAKRSNNHFGIKCHIEWGGDTIVKTDDTLNECFRKYKSVEDSYTDHSMFLKSRSRYAGLFEIPVTDYKGWCYGLKSAGYATYPCYAEELIRIIEENKLYELDRAEKMTVGFVHFSQPQLIKSSLDSKALNLDNTAKSEILFLNEQDVPIQSLELILKHHTEEPEELVKSQ